MLKPRKQNKCVATKRRIVGTPYHGYYRYQGKLSLGSCKPEVEVELPTRLGYMSPERAIAQLTNPQFAHRMQVARGYEITNADLAKGRALIDADFGKVGEVLPPELEIKGVHLKQSSLPIAQVEELVKRFGEEAERKLIADIAAGGWVVNKEDSETIQRIGRRALQRATEHAARNRK